MKHYRLHAGKNPSKLDLCQLVATYEIKNQIRAYNETTIEYSVKSLVGHHVGDEHTEDLFRVEWEGYVGEDTWEPESGLPPELVLEFRTRHLGLDASSR
jgi:hypothetical protein